ncbi:DAK2 domain-containing protein [Williamsia sp. SKLECPSW1]
MSAIGPNAAGTGPPGGPGGGARKAGLDAGVVRDWFEVCVGRLTALRAEINDLNVFPIPDSDTGSNMLHTMTAASDAAGATEESAEPAQVLRAAADAAVGQARGNSGIILSQVLVGLADAAGVETVDGALSFNRLWAAGLGLAGLAATRAVSEPREGTVLTVLRETGQTASADAPGMSPGDLARSVADACADALDRTTEQLPELAAAGVVDAGGRGLLVLLDAMVEVLTGVSAPRRRYEGALSGGGDARAHVIVEDGCDEVSAEMDYEVMYAITGAAVDRIPTLRTALDDLGDAVVIVGDSSADTGERFSVHVHTCDAGAAVEAGLAVGEVSDIRISCFVLDAHKASTDSSDRLPTRRRAVVTVVAGEGAAELFASEGAHVVRAGEGAAAVDAEAIAAAIVDVDAAHVVVMANGAVPAQDLVTVAASARSAHRAVVFLPTLSMVQALSALAVHDIAASPDADAYAMAEAAASTRRGSLVTATETALTLAGTCEPGDLLGLIGVDVLVIGPDQVSAATALVDLMLGTGGELVTVLAGADIADGVVDALERHVSSAHPGVEFVAYTAGQPGEVLQVGVE